MRGYCFRSLCIALVFSQHSIPLAQDVHHIWLGGWQANAAHALNLA